MAKEGLQLTNFHVLPGCSTTRSVLMSARERAEASRDMEVYAAMIDYMDEQIKRVFDHLKVIGKYENTMIIFFSDNGAKVLNGTDSST